MGDLGVQRILSGFQSTRLDRVDFAAAVAARDCAPGERQRGERAPFGAVRRRGDSGCLASAGLVSDFCCEKGLCSRGTVWK